MRLDPLGYYCYCYYYYYYYYYQQQALQIAEELRVKVQQKIDFHDKNAKAVGKYI